MKKIPTIILIFSFFIAPNFASALFMPQTANDLADMANLSANSYVVTNALTGEVLISKNADAPWVPASLTKLVTALVVLDSKPKLSKLVAMTQDDQTIGQCGHGGACIKSKAGVKFTVDGLFHAALMPSANNAANALARSTGLSQADFVAKMNQKAASLGAVNSHFNEPTGLDPANTITALDYSKIITAAFSNEYLKKIAGLNTYALHSGNNIRYNQTIKNTDKLLADSSVQVLGAKTGYLDESHYNFAALLTEGDRQLAIVVLGEYHLYSAFAETKQLVSLANVAKELALQSLPQVLGTSTSISIKN